MYIVLVKSCGQMGMKLILNYSVLPLKCYKRFGQYQICQIVLMLCIARKTL